MRAIATWLGMAIIFCLPRPDNLAAEPEVKANLLTLPGARLAQTRLAMPAQLNYQYAPLRDCVAQMAERFQFSYWIDRRVDADKPLTLALPQSNVGECLERLADLCGAKVGLVENVITIAHPDQLASMQYVAIRLHDQLSQSDPAALKQAQLRPLQWTILTTPMEMADLLNNQWSLSLKPTLPHDLMNAGQLQPSTLATQLTLFYGGFNQCVAGKRVNELRIVPLPTAAPWRASYSAGSVNENNVTAVKESFPEARIEKQGGLWTLSGTTAAHQRLLAAATTAGNDRPNQSRGGNRSNSNRPMNNRSSDTAQSNGRSADLLAQQRYTISKMEGQPIRGVLTALAKQLGLELVWDPALPASASLIPVTIEAKDTKLDEILGQLAKQSKLNIRRDGQKVDVRAE